MQLKTFLGTVRELTPYNNTCKRLVISVNRSFGTDYIQFFVTKAHQLRKNEIGEPCVVGDDVEVQTWVEKGYNRLISVKSAIIDYCPICRRGLEAIDTQRMDCAGCKNCSDDFRKEWVNEEMTLTSSVAIEYVYSTGYRLEFIEHVTSRPMVFVVFASKPLLFSKVNTLRVGGAFNVSGWRDAKNRFEVIDII